MNQQELRDWERRCIQEESPWCQAACPLRMDARAFLARMAAGDAAGARAILERTMPLTGVLGRICDHPCEPACKRAEAGEPLAIGALERACVTAAAPGRKPLALPGRGTTVAVLGAGLAGLTAAWDLARKGHGVTLYAVDGVLGGPLRDLPGDLLPPAVLEEDIRRVLSLGPTVEAVARLDAALVDAALARAGAVILDLTCAPDLGPASRDGLAPVTLAHPDGRAGLFCAGWPGPDGRPSFVWQAADGRRAAASADRQISGASLLAARDKEGPFRTRLFTSLAGIAPLSRVRPADPAGYTPAEAASEAARCLDCQCLECVKVCEFLARYKAYPRTYARQIYNNAAIVKGLHLANRLINSCMLCGLCTEVCPEDFSMADLCLTARRDMVARGAMPPSAHEFALEDMAFNNGPDFALARPDPALGACARVFVPGCQLAASHPHHVRAVYDFLRAGLPGGVGILLHCCGAPARWAGREDLFAESLAGLRARWEDLGRPEMVVACSTCLGLLREELPEARPTSLWEVLRRTGLPGPRGVVPPGPLAVHDPCTTRHDASNQAAVRGLLTDLGLPFEELALSGPLTECCGYGGLQWNADPGLARATAARRAAESPLDYLASCAMCRDRLAREGKRVYHLLDLLFPCADADPAAAPGPGFSARQAARAGLRRDLLREVFGERAPEPEEGPRLILDAATAALLDERHILDSDLRRVLAESAASGRFLQDRASGRFLAGFRPRKVTFWVEYLPEADGVRVLRAWSHRMEMGPGGGGASAGADQSYAPDSGDWVCSCGKKLGPAPVEATYLGSSFAISLYACPDCGQVLVPESLALGRMLEVEQLLEDK